MRSRAAIRLLLCAAALGLAVRAGAQGGGWEAIPSPATPGGYEVQVDVDGAAPVTLESFQSGLSWLTVLRKREAFREPTSMIGRG